MLESTLDRFIGKKVTIRIFNHEISTGILHKISGCYGCEIDGKVSIIYPSDAIVSVKEAKNE